MKNLLNLIYAILFIHILSFSASGLDDIPESAANAPGTDQVEQENESSQNSIENNIPGIEQEPVFPQKKAVSFSVKAGIEPYFGYTQYQIGGIVKLPGDDTLYKTYADPISELKFPLNVFMATFDINFKIYEKFLIHANIKKNFTDDAGKTKDSDWGALYDYTGDHYALDVYSESDSKLDAWIINGDIQIKTLDKSFFSLNAGAGYLFQRFDFVISNLDQTYPTYAPDVHDKVSGKIGTYKIDYYIPYAVITPCFDINNKIKIEHNIAFGYAIAEDTDDHLLRYKRSTGRSEGFAFITSVKADFYYIPQVVFSLCFNYMYLEAEGTQEQYQYKEYDGTKVGPIAEIDNKIESEQYSINISAGISF